MNYKKLNRKIHYWGALACAIPLIIISVTGVLLLLKKEFNWIQPPTIKGETKVPNIDFNDILLNLKKSDQLNINSWKQIKRLDVRPSKGVIKIQLKDNWEVQMDHQSGEILHVAFRRSDIIESIHDGSYFHDLAKLWLFLPAALILILLWITGMYLFAITELAKQRSRIKKRAQLNIS